jgi:hypothetical protein
MWTSSLGRTAVAFVAAGTVVLCLGGCRVESGSRQPASTKVTQVLDSGQGRFDLTGPPSRDEAGMAAGRPDVTYQREDHKPFHVLVLLPEGRQIDVDARLVTFDAWAEADPRAASPTTMDIHCYAATLDAGRDHLLAVARQFGFETKVVADWYDEAKNPRPVQAPATARTPWLGANVGYLRLEVQGSYKPPVDTPESDQTVVHYLLTWGASPKPGPS